MEGLKFKNNEEVELTFAHDESDIFEEEIKQAGTATGPSSEQA